jgi:hypothetical protein
MSTTTDAAQIRDEIDDVREALLQTTEKLNDVRQALEKKLKKDAPRQPIPPAIAQQYADHLSRVTSDVEEWVLCEAVPKLVAAEVVCNDLLSKHSLTDKQRELTPQVRSLLGQAVHGGVGDAEALFSDWVMSFERVPDDAKNGGGAS